MHTSDSIYPKLESKIKELRENFKRDLDLSKFERELRAATDELIAAEIEGTVNETLSGVQFLDSLRVLAGKKDMRFRGYREVGLRLLSGIEIRVASPYFSRNKKKKRGRKPRGRRKGNNPHCHLGLSVLGVIGRCTGNLASEVCKMAVLAPSFEVCRSLLADRGIKMDKKTIRRICRVLGGVTMEHRGRISFSGTENWKGYTLVIGKDGGRLRLRLPKPGRKKDGQILQGFYTDWKEPKLFTIYLMDPQGSIVKDFPPIHDATMGDKDKVFELLRTYMDQIPLGQLSRIVFCADGAPWIWSRVERLFAEIAPGIPTFQVLDYTHAKQALGNIVELLPKRHPHREKTAELWKAALWKGDIDGLKTLICTEIKGAKRKKALKKWRDYFKANEHRMQYQYFEQLKIPTGSGCVESAIRRVINMRIKAPETFWKKDMAETFLFLRSQLISGRWNILMRNSRKSLVENWGLTENQRITQNPEEESLLWNLVA